MKLKYLIIGIIAILLLIAPGLVVAETYGTITCTHYGFPLYIYACSDSKLFWSEQAMNSYYTPPLEEIFVPERTYLYVTGGSTETLSGT